MEKLDLQLITKDELLTLASNAANRFMADKNPEVQKKIFTIVGDEINRRRKDEEAEAYIAGLDEYQNMDTEEQLSGDPSEGARLNGDYR